MKNDRLHPYLLAALLGLMTGSLIAISLNLGRIADVLEKLPR